MIVVINHWKMCFYSMDLNKMVIMKSLKIHKNIIKMLSKINYNIELYQEKI